jgi:hypothetical protein
MKIINITDVGTGSRVLINHGGKLTVKLSGGCPVEDILRGIRNYSDGQKLADVVLAKWLRSYDGDPRLNQLSVEVRATNGDLLGHAEAR